jgi:hypothetical protein
MTLDYVTIRRPILILKGYSANKKILLGLVDSFNSKGLKMSNAGLAEILDVRADYVSNLLSELESSGDIRIENRQSRYRTIYFGEKSKVNDVLLRTKPLSKKVLLRTLPQSTSDFSPNIIEGTKERAHTPKRKTFVKPTPGEVSVYASSIGFKLDGQYFCDSYESKGWLVGKSPMMDWRATVRTWKDRDENRNGKYEDCGCVLTQDTDPEEAARLRVEMLRAG